MATNQLTEIAVGTIAKGVDVGLAYRGNRKVIWHACVLCGRKRWVCLRRGKPQSQRCLFHPYAKTPKLNDEQKAEVAQRYLAGETMQELADARGVCSVTILNYLRAMGIESRPTGGPGQEPKLNDELRESIVADYKEGSPSRALARKYGVSKSSLLSVLEKSGTDRRTSSEAKRLPVDEAVFDNPGPEGRYWIGFLMADGCVVERGASPDIKLGLAYADLAHVEAFRSFVGSSHKIQRIDRDIPTDFFGRTYIKHGRASISFTSRRIADALAKFGVVPRKSKTARVRGGLEYDADFWRGAIDGDGSVGWHRPNFPYVAFCGSEMIVSQFISFVARLIPGKNLSLHKNKHGLRSCKCSGSFARTIIDRLYRNCVRSLPRKLQTAREIITLHDECRRR